MKFNYQNHPKNYIILIKIFLFSFILHTFKSEEINCPTNKPILKSGQCKLEYCTKQQFSSSECKIANPIIETQWLNNIILFGANTSRYLIFGSFSNGDMVVEATCYPKLPNRIFYGLKGNGRPFFINKDTNQETPKKTIIVTTNKGQYEMEGSIIKLSGTQNNGKEYFISVSKLEGYAEIFDFDNEVIKSKQMAVFTSIKNVKTIRHPLIPLYNTSSEYYYLFAFIGSESSSSSENVYFQKHIFNSINTFGQTNTYNTNMKTKNNGYNKGMSCFKTNLEKIICFYSTKKDNKKYFNLHKFEKDFSDDLILQIETNLEVEKLYYKCIHLKGEVGVFSYYDEYSSNVYPVFLFKEFTNEYFNNYL